MQRLRDFAAVLSLVDEPVAKHLREHEVAPRAHALGLSDQRVRIRAASHRHERRGLRRTEIARRFVEVDAAPASMPSTVRPPIVPR